MSDQIVKTLNHLIETSKNGEKGFLAASEDAKNPELKALLSKRSQECASAATELQAVVSRLGGKPEDSGTVTGAMHRGWVNLKAAVAGREDKAVLEECERGEDHAKAEYQKALNEAALPEDIRQLVQRQYDGVLRNHDQIKALRDQERARG
ncbi:PA2169 family four-helix-bundle protein [Verticiella sediminum]|uniref:PA2169 family four-helix-bundle protein n=1 Tax=Verticiella sediminum TaxID=1247510 RepID=A0A556A7N1_9BURK|nr:PA2169 family four-helix-bundle protein [Verticiella sediminum]TSH88893.1 PA2169 family four-helix-bundle protein [Verticiella sediminum]